MVLGFSHITFRTRNLQPENLFLASINQLMDNIIQNFLNKVSSNYYIFCANSS